MRGMGQSATFPTFSLRIESVSREDAFIYYQVGEKKTEFYAAVGPGRSIFRSSIITTIPKETGDEEAARIAADLALGLSKLGYDYKVFRAGASPDKALLAHSAGVSSVKA